MEKISVIVPVYKVEKYLEKCINSIIGQTYKNLEIILVDDGSPDRCGEICDEYAKKDDRIKVIHKENGGLSDARNAGLDIAAGEYIGFVDSDDYIAPDMYDKLYKAVRENSAEIGLCNCKCVGEGDYDNDHSPIKDGVISGRDILFKALYKPKKWYWVVAWNKLYKSDIFDGIRFPVGKINEDEFTIHKIMYNCEAVACVEEMLYFYVQRGDSIMGSTMTVSSFDYIEARFDRAEFFVKNNCAIEIIYKELVINITLMTQKYHQCKDQQGARERYRELVRQYRKIVSFELLRQLHPKKALLLCVNYISPYMCSRVLNGLRRLKNKF